MTRTLLLVASNFPPVHGGSAMVYDNVARAAKGAVEVLAPRIGYSDGLPLNDWREHDRLAPYTVHRVRLLRTLLPSGGGLPWWRVARLASDVVIRLTVLVAILRILRRRHHDAVCLGELMASGWLIRLLQGLAKLRVVAPGLHVIVYVHGEEVTMQNADERSRRRCRALLCRADGVVVVSRFTRLAVLDLIGHDKSGKVKLIPNGVESQRFTPGPKAPDLERRYGVEGAFVFLSLCRLLEKKGTDQALRAFAAIRGEACGQTRRRMFLVAGTGPYEATLRELVEELGIAADVRFTGPVPEHRLVDLYRLGDVFVMPNRALPNGDTEGFGLVFLEANSCGLPVIAGHDGGTADAVRHGVNGLVVDGRSVPDIAGAMSELSADGLLRQKLRHAGLVLAWNADWAPKVEIFLDFCLGPEPPPARRAGRLQGWLRRQIRRLPAWQRRARSPTYRAGIVKQGTAGTPFVS